ncbi:hypothetical protein ACHAWO_012598 [Cyclotella atomus]|uniref:Uncharacterized protein n=1 Tax=Cyclotella atomus TaxID=382360 RepID=A0ABD3Q685_9STRA
MRSTAFILALVTSAVAQEFVHQKRVPYHPDRPSPREVVTEKFARREEILTGMLEQRQARLAEHESGRKLLSDEELTQHNNHIDSLRRKLAVHKNKDPKILQLEIEEEIALYEKMMYGEEFKWTSDGMILNEP